MSSKGSATLLLSKLWRKSPCSQSQTCPAVQLCALTHNCRPSGWLLLLQPAHGRCGSDPRYNLSMLAACCSKLRDCFSAVLKALLSCRRAFVDVSQRHPPKARYASS